MKMNARQLARVYVEMTEGKSGKEGEHIAATFVRFLFERRELQQWRDIVRSIEDVWMEKHGIANVTITSAHPLSTSARKALQSAAYGATMREVIDPSLIGGARVRIDDRVVDVSVAGHLSALKSHLMTA